VPVPGCRSRSVSVDRAFRFELLAIRGEPLKGPYTVRDVAQLFGVSVRAIQEWVSSGRLEARDLPGRSRFLPLDLEALLSKKAKRRTNRFRLGAFSALYRARDRRFLKWAPFF
jgi:excisionase family DNA binding protein